MTVYPLNRTAIPKLDGTAFVVPGYGPTDTRVGHAHIGPGVFHRGHQAMYSDNLLNNGFTDAAICAISMRSRELASQLRGQDMFYTVIGSERRMRVVGSIREIMSASDDIHSVIERLADPAVKVVTMTVTEAGYCWSAESGSLDGDDPGIVHDIDNPRSPITMPGLLLAALANRKNKGVEPFAIVPCDNLLSNGKITATVLSQLAEVTDPALEPWLSEAVPVHGTMVDRMVPSTTDGDRSAVLRAGVRDEIPIRTEEFSQWVIEQRDGSILPPWDSVGVDFVTDVEPFERLKLQVLNASHSAIAYLGLNGGHTLVDTAARDPQIRATTTAMIRDEVAAVVSGMQTDADNVFRRYTETTFERFSNAALGYTTAKVASDGARKIQQRILPSVARLVEDQQPFDNIAKVLAAWIWSMWGGNSDRLSVKDPWFESVVHVDPTLDPASFAAAVIREPVVFGNLAGSTTITEGVAKHVDEIWATGRNARLQ